MPELMESCFIISARGRDELLECWSQVYFSNILSVIDLPLVFQEKILNLYRESNPGSLAFLIGFQSFTPSRFKYGVRLKSLSCICYDNLFPSTQHLSCHLCQMCELYCSCFLGFKINFSVAVNAFNREIYRWTQTLIII